MKRKLTNCKIIFVSIIIFFGCTSVPKNHDMLFQTSTINALLEAIYDGETTCKELKDFGNFGLGTFNNLDGEMVMLNDTIFQVKSDGFVYLANDTLKTPFATVTFFEADECIELKQESNYDSLKQFLDENITSENIFYAILMNGKFDFIKVRSVPKQNKPYPPLVEVAKIQPVFTYENIEGTILGFRCPEYVKGINVPGYHFHFISKDRKVGGHLLDCQLKNITIQLDETSNFYMKLPKDESFQKLDLEKDKQKELEEVES